MAKFMVRVVLHGAGTAEHYDLLDTAMREKGFSQELMGKKSVHRLPRGDYWYTAETTAPEVRMVAAAAAEQAGESFGIIVVRVDGWSVMGLKKAAAPASE